jgi:hypothetical protein
MKNQLPPPPPPHGLNPSEAHAGAFKSTRSWFWTLCKKAVYVLPLTLLFFFISCRDDVNTVAPSTEFVYENVPWNSKGKLLEKFGIGISKAMHSEQFRRLIRNEAMKRFNRDTDVLYAFVKDVPINSTAQMRTSDGGTEQMPFSTLHEFLVPFFSSEAELVAAEQQIPLLTIFVPTLPEDSFSPELWDVADEEQIPDVALALDNISYVPVIGREGNNYLIEPGYVPGYPIVALKENERVISSRNPRFDELDTRILNADGSSSGRFSRPDIDRLPDGGGRGINWGELDVPIYRFRDNNFDQFFWRNRGRQDTNQGQGYRGASDDYIPDYLIKAYKTFKNSPKGWHRDNVYYGLTPDNTEGEFIGRKYRETIATIKIVGNNLTSVFNSLSDSFAESNPDPILRDWSRQKYAFTEGDFELVATVHIGQKSEMAGVSISKGHPFSPDELFEIRWQTEKRGWWVFEKTYYKPHIVSAKTVNTANPNGLRWTFQDWSLEKKTTGWRIDFMELDAKSEETSKRTWANEFNANIKAVPGEGIMKKFGLEFGASFKQTKTNEFTVKVIGDSDEIASGHPIAFSDNILEYYDGRYHLRTYDVNKVRISFVPVQVEDF